MKISGLSVQQKYDAQQVIFRGRVDLFADNRRNRLATQDCGAVSLFS